MKENMYNDGLNSDEFKKYLAKYNEYFDKVKKDITFLDKEDEPTDTQINEVFTTPEDYKASLDIENYDVSEIGEPDVVRTLEGSIWTISKLVWFKKEGRIILNILSKTEDEVQYGEDEFGNPFSYMRMEEEESFIEYETPSYEDLLEEAIQNEDYDEAVKLRDWKAELEVFSNEMNAAIKEGDVNGFFRIVDELNNHKSKLYK